MKIRTKPLASICAVLVVLATLALMPAYLTTAAPGTLEQENEPIVHRGSTACGVERWFVKTGMDRFRRGGNIRP